MIRRTVAIGLGVVALVAAPDGATSGTEAGPVALDRSFGVAGKILTKVGQPRVFAADVANAPGGGLYVAANSGPRGPNLEGGRLLVLRYNRDGRLRRGFGRRGVAAVSLAQGPATASALVVQPDGRIVVVGSVGASGSQDLLVARLNREGALDVSFGADGVETADLGGEGKEAAADVLVQPDGSIVVVGSVDTKLPAQGPYGDGVILRFRSDGTPDPSFGSNGVVRISTPNPLHYMDAQAVALRSDGSILVGGNSGDVAHGNNRIVIVPLGPDGSVDSSFGYFGVVYLGTSNDVLHDLTLAERSGRIYLAGHTRSEVDASTRFYLAALRLDLAPDESFGRAGETRLSFARSPLDIATSLAIDLRQRIVLVGTSFRRPRGQFAFARFRPSGRLDMRFGRRGRVRVNLGRGWNVARALLVQSRGQLVAAGDNGGIGGTGRAITLVRLRG